LGDTLYILWFAVLVFSSWIVFVARLQQFVSLFKRE